MVKHWWQVKGSQKGWMKKIAINGIGLVLTGFILISMIVLKFDEGGWITLFITGALVLLAVMIKKHYRHTSRLLERLGTLVPVAEASESHILPDAPKDIDMTHKPDTEAKTAVLLVSGFNGMGLHTLLGVMRLFGGAFKNFVFVQVGIIDAGNFKGVTEVENLKDAVQRSVNRYIKFMNKNGYYAEGMGTVAVNVADEVTELAPGIIQKYPNAVFFGGQLIFEQDTVISKIFYNYTVFTLQKRLYREGIPFVILPIKV